MQNGKINFKIKGGALSLLCVAGAFKLGVDALIAINEWGERDRARKGIKEAAEAIEKINVILDKVEVREAEEKVEETEES